MACKYVVQRIHFEATSYIVRDVLITSIFQFSYDARPRKSKSCTPSESCPSHSDTSLMPPPGVVRSVGSSRGRASSVDRVLPHHKWGVLGEQRRLSSSPTHSHTSRRKHRKPSFDRVLDSQIMQVFHRDSVTPESTVGSTKVIRNSSYESEEEGNILNMNKIKKLTKLS